MPAILHNTISPPVGAGHACDLTQHEPYRLQSCVIKKPQAQRSALRLFFIKTNYNELQRRALRARG